MEILALIEKISYIRNRANLSARKLSIAIGKNPGYIHMLETNKNFAPTFDTLMTILEVCNTSIEEFFYYEISQYQQDKELLNLLKLCKDKEKKDAIITLLKK